MDLPVAETPQGHFERIDEPLGWVVLGQGQSRPVDQDGGHGLTQPTAKQHGRAFTPRSPGPIVHSLSSTRALCGTPVGAMGERAS